MKILVHFTTLKRVFDYYTDDESRVSSYQLSEVKNFYNKYNTYQKEILFVVYRNNSEFTVGKITYDNDSDSFMYRRLNSTTEQNVFDELGFSEYNPYESDRFYIEYEITESSFVSIPLECSNSNKKIRLKYYEWGEKETMKILHEKLNDILFDENNVLNLGTTYCPSKNMNHYVKRRKYFAALKDIGFISTNKNKINIQSHVLHGDIGEFLMHIFICKYFTITNVDYYYPKLIFKTNPKMPVYGNDGTLYSKTDNQIFHLEAKFYTELSAGIEAALDSLEKHISPNEIEDYNAKIEVFRDISTDEREKLEIVEITDSTIQTCIVFVLCSDRKKHSDINETLKNIMKRKKYKSITKEFEVLVFILPIINKTNFLKMFKRHGKNISNMEVSSEK